MHVIAAGTAAFLLLAQPAAHSATADAQDSTTDTLQAQLRSTFAENLTRDEQTFARALDAELSDAIAVVERNTDLTDEQAQRARIVLTYEWARGRFAYINRHGAAVGRPDWRPSATYLDFIERLDPTRTDWLDIPSYAQAMLAWRDFRAARLRENPDAVENSVNIRLASQLRAGATFETPQMRCFLDGNSLTKQLEDFAADGIRNEPESYAERCPGETADTILAGFESERAAREGHSIAVYKTVDDAPLELHIYAPDTATQTGRPAVVWLHGGGWYTGSWSWCGVCTVFKERDLVVAQVEYRLGARHGTNIGDAIADAQDATVWLREHADRYGIDPERIIVAGFSAGGHLALSVATLPGIRDTASPDLVVGVSACVDLTDTDWGVQQAGSPDAARDWSPRFHAAATQAPVLLLNNGRDHLCTIASVEDYVARSGGMAQLVSSENAGHFSIYSDRELRDRSYAEINRFLERHGF